MNDNKEKHSISQLRQDLVTGDWVVIATGRGKRPHAFSGNPSTVKEPKENCPFESFAEEGPFVPLLREGSVTVIPNKFPAFASGVCKVFSKEGPYTFADGVGFHEVFVLKDHDRYIPDLETEEVKDLVRAYRERYNSIAKQECIAYVSVFHNHGREAGASLAHPHSQLIAIPIIPADVERSVAGSARYFKEHGKCAHCEMLAHELAARSRIIAENEKFVAFVPFASRIAFEVRIFPKAHQHGFGMLKDEDISFVADMLKQSLAKLRVGLNDPAYNFFIHTAPVGSADAYEHYHWHIEILPRTSTWAGFELGTSIEISAIAPEDAAEFLRGTETSK